MVSALLRPVSIPGKILDLVLVREVSLALDSRILGEYESVLFRPEFQLPRESIQGLLAFLRQTSTHIHRSPSWPVALPDPEDTMFLEVAVGAYAQALVTGNLKRFPPACRCGVPVFSPREWLSLWAG